MTKEKEFVKVTELGSFELQVEQFKQFLLAQGIHNNRVNLLQISK